MCLSFFQIKDLVQSRSKSAFTQKDTYLAFSFNFFQCSPIILASFKSKISNVFCPSIFLHFRMVWLCTYNAKNVIYSSRVLGMFYGSFISQAKMLHSVNLTNHVKLKRKEQLFFFPGIVQSKVSKVVMDHVTTRFLLPRSSLYQKKNSEFTFYLYLL